VLSCGVPVRVGPHASMAAEFVSHRTSLVRTGWWIEWMPPNCWEVGDGVGRVGRSISMKKLWSALFGSKLEKGAGTQDESSSIWHVSCPGNLGTWCPVFCAGANVAAQGWVGHAAGEAFGQA
jgi:hypothetical protein